MHKINKYLSIFIISLFSTTAKSQTITMPSSLTADTYRIDKYGSGHQNYLKFDAFKTF
jgi:hypothetical protein